MPAGFIVTTCAGQRRPIAQPEPDTGFPIRSSMVTITDRIRSNSSGRSSWSRNVLRRLTYNPSFSLLHREHNVNVGRQILIGIVPSRMPSRPWLEK